MAQPKLEQIFGEVSSNVKPAKSLYGATLVGAAGDADLLDFYADKIADKLGIPQTKNSIFEYLRDNWATYGKKLKSEGVTQPLARAIYEGAGGALWEVPKLLGLGKALRGARAATLPAMGAVRGFKEGGIPGASIGATTGAITHGTLKGLHLALGQVSL